MVCLGLLMLSTYRYPPSAGVMSKCSSHYQCTIFFPLRNDSVTSSDCASRTGALSRTVPQPSPSPHRMAGIAVARRQHSLFGSRLKNGSTSKQAQRRRPANSRRSDCIHHPPPLHGGEE